MLHLEFGPNHALIYCLKLEDVSNFMFDESSERVA